MLNEAAVIPSSILTLAYWLHMLATVVWIGGLAVLSILVLPTAQKTLDRAGYAVFVTQLLNRFQQIGWFSLLLLIVTGMFQMSSHPSYDGFLAIDNTWAAAILAKHVVIGGMVLVSGYMTWGLFPAMKRTALLRAAGRAIDADQEERLQRRERLLLWANLVLSFVVLFLTAWARTSG